MDEEKFNSLSLKYDILRHIGPQNHEVKIWAMYRMFLEKKIDTHEWGSNICYSFSKKGKKYDDIMDVVEKLVNRQIFLKEDEKAHIITYRFTGKGNELFESFLNGVAEEMQRLDEKDAGRIFTQCLEQENEKAYVGYNKVEIFSNLRGPKNKFFDFMKGLLKNNATVCVELLLQIASRLQ